MVSNNLKILAIDDNRDNLLVLRAVLSDKLPEATIITADDGPSGIEIAVSEDPTVILLDIVMPGMDGYEVCKKLKGAPRTQTIPVLFLTALRTDLDSRIRALETGADGFLPKPFDEAELIAQIQAMTKVKVANCQQMMEKEQLLALVEERTHKLQQEIVERTQAEVALQESNRLMESLIQTLPFPLHIVNQQGRVLFMSPLMAQTVGKGELGRYCWDLYKDDQKQCTNCPLLQSIQVGKTTSIESAAVFGGRIYEILHTGMMYKGQEALLEIFLDRTERKKAETALLENEEKFRNLLESTSTVPWERDLESSEFTYMGHQIEQILGYSPTSWKGMDDWIERLHLEDREDTVQFCEIETRKGRNHDFVYRAIHKDGSYRWIRNVVSVVMDSGVPQKLIGFMQDITHQIEMEHEQEEMASKLQQAQKMEAIGTLAGGIAHDFNNILSVILGYTEMAREDSESGSVIANNLNMVLDAGDRARNLVKQILAFSRQEQAQFVLFQPAHIVQETIKMLRPTLPSTININQDIEILSSSIFAEPSQLNQILVNLCTNAFHAMEETGGDLDICLKETYLERGDSILEQNLNPGQYVQLSIHDSGHGIPQEIKAKIFDPYFTTKEPGKGTGMGLSIIHGIVKSFGGFISVVSEKDKGSIFHVFIPVSKKEQLSENDAADCVLKGNENILFVDDEQILAEMDKRMLERLGYNVTIKSSSLEALTTFHKHHDQFDLVITDQTMPEMTGADLARRMIQIRPDIPIILCTGFSSIISEKGAKSIGIKGFAHKPLTKEDLSKLIRKVLNEA
jgi:PAS domain S-box-containing protein